MRYLGSILQKNRELDGAVNHRIQAGWMKRKNALCVLCKRRMPLKLKGKFYKMTIKTKMFYGMECWVVKHLTRAKNECSGNKNVSFDVWAH